MANEKSAGGMLFNFKKRVKYIKSAWAAPESRLAREDLRKSFVHPLVWSRELRRKNLNINRILSVYSL